MRFSLWTSMLMVGLAFSPAAHEFERMGQRASEAKQPSATVHIQLVSNEGIELTGEGEVEVQRFQDDSNGPDLAKKFKHGTASGVPYGVYTLRVRTAGFWSAEREVRVFQPSVLTVVSLEIGMGRTEGGLPTAMFDGKIKNLASPSTSLRVRLSGIYSTTIMDAKVESDGRFLLSGVPYGVYILVVTRNADFASDQKPRVLASEEVRVPLTAPLLIDLKDK
ncbi:MAG TPA: hypothetical protein VLX60_07425 [Terriglobales bacterium]|nr:hypothetical protein [Terriglobales bacterium]